MTRYRDLISQLGQLQTEQTNSATANIDRLPASEIVKLINAEDQKVAGVVQHALPEIARSAELFAETIKHDGRVFYIGAGTSGRLGVLDAAECPPTFGTDPTQVVGVIAGGYDTLVMSAEGVEDRQEAAADDLRAHELNSRDMVIGLAASRRTPYTLAGLSFAQSLGCKTAFIICNDVDLDWKKQAVISSLDQLIVLPVGPEAITGSTRMKSGTAQKMALNLISTTAMVLIGKTFGNLMVDLQARSEKLAARSRKILVDLLSITLEQADDLLLRAGGSVKIAIVMQLQNCNKTMAETLLQQHDGHLAPALDPKN